MSEGERVKPVISRRQFVAAAMITAAVRPRDGNAASRRATAQDDPVEADIESLHLSRDTLAEAEKIACIALTDAERDQVLRTLAGMIERFRKRRAIDIPLSLAPATIFSPLSAGMAIEPGETVVRLAERDPAPLPERDEDIAFAPVTQLSQWLHAGAITSARLTEIYLERLRSLGPKLECVVTLTEELAMEQAVRADAELQAGNSRGPLHGIPWGAKDLLDTAGVLTTFGAEPYQERVAEMNAIVVQRLADAGAVLLAKLSLGALAYGDIWFGGRTRSPWNLEQGSSGSSAGSASATAAGLVGFSLGTETYGSIVSPSMVCGTTGLRPTFGRVARTGAMPLCWSLDKIGPICRTVEDCALVLGAITGADPGDPSSVDVPLEYHGDAPLRRLRIGIKSRWFEEEPATDIDRQALALARAMDVRLVEIELPDWPYDVLESILIAEAASAFEELTISNTDDQLAWQDDEAWPNTFRMTRFMPAVEMVQADRFRRRVCEMMAAVFDDVDVILAPSFAGQLLLITNFTGHPSLTIRAGFAEDGTPHGITMIGRLFDEGTLCRFGFELEQQLDVWHARPAIE